MLASKINLDIEAKLENRFIGYFDIMGFKSMISTDGIKEVYKKLLEIQLVISKEESNQGVIYGNSKLKSIIFSDSFFFYTESDTQEDLNTLITRMSLYQGELFKIGLPFRGAISHGETIIDTSNKPIFIGQPLIDAYLLEMELLFYGIIVHHSVTKKIDNYNGYQNKFIIETEIPLKGGKVTHEIIAPFNIFIPDDQRLTIFSHNSLLKYIKTFKKTSSGKLRVYLDNTLKIFNELREKNFPQNKQLEK